MSDVPLIKQFLQHQSDFMSYLMAITRDFDASEEIFQNAAIVVMERSSDDEPIRDFRAWAKEVVRRQALRHLRAQTKEQWIRSLEPVLLDQISRVFMEGGADESVTKREAAALQRCIGQATDEQRRLLELRYEQRASFADIGRLVGRSEAAVQRSLSRIRKQLHDCVRFQVRLAEVNG